MAESRIRKYLRWLKRIRNRRNALDQMDLKLRRMRKLAEEATKKDLETNRRETIQDEFDRLQQEVNELDDKSRKD